MHNMLIFSTCLYQNLAQEAGGQRNEPSVDVFQPRGQNKIYVTTFSLTMKHCSYCMTCVFQQKRTLDRFSNLFSSAAIMVL